MNWRDDPPERSRHKARSEATKKEGTTQQTDQRPILGQGIMRMCVHDGTIRKSFALEKAFLAMGVFGTNC